MIRFWIHGAAAVGFAIMLPISLFTSLKDSVPWLVFLSVWALISNHWGYAEAAWNAHKAKLKAQESQESQSQ